MATLRQIRLLNRRPWEYIKAIVDEFHPNFKAHPTQGLNIYVE